MLNRKPVVLLIEDDENVNAANRQFLEREGYAVRVARGIAEARRLAQGCQVSPPLPQKRV